MYRHVWIIYTEQKNFSNKRRIRVDSKPTDWHVKNSNAQIRTTKRKPIFIWLTFQFGAVYLFYTELRITYLVGLYTQHSTAHSFHLRTPRCEHRLNNQPTMFDLLPVVLLNALRQYKFDGFPLWRMADGKDHVKIEVTFRKTTTNQRFDKKGAESRR